MERTLIVSIMKKAKYLSLQRNPVCMVIDSWSPPGWGEIIYYTVRLPDGMLSEQVRPEELKFL